MTIPGIGYYSAVLMKSEIGDLNRFLLVRGFAVTLAWCLPRMLPDALLGTAASPRREAGG